MRYGMMIAAAGAALMMAAPAQAQDRGGYVALSAGVESVQDTDIRYYDVGGTFGGTGATDSAATTVEFKRATTFGGAAGYDFGTVRADIEVSYARNKLEAITVDSLNGTAVTLSPADAADVCDYLEATGCSASGNRISFTNGGRIRQLSALANVWFDLPVGSGITPYAGGGVGATGFESDGEGSATFAWQLGAGVAVRVTKGVSLTVDYRYRSSQGKDIAYDANSGFEVGRIKTSSFTGGLRFTF